MKSRFEKVGKYIKSMSRTDIFILLIAFIGILIRLIYIAHTKYDVRQHDSVSIQYDEGHLAYIWYWFDNFRLPDFDPRKYWQFYQPPLHHIIAAIWLKLNAMTGLDLMTAVENIQILTTFYSCMTVYFCYKIFNELGISGKGLVAAFTIVCLHPTLILMSGSINNDILCIMLGMTVILSTIRWYKSPELKKIILIAVLLGLTMMTKTSGALLAPAIAFVFAYRFVRWSAEGIKKKSYLKTIDLLKQFAAFLCISVPLGMWWGIYCNIRFKVPFGYVPKLPKELDQYIGRYSVWDRFFDFNPNQFASVFENWGRPSFEHNIIIAILKTSLFGEYDFSQTTAAVVLPATFAFWANCAVVVISVVAMIYVCFKRYPEVDAVIKVFLGLVYAVAMGSFIKFCFVFAHTCTMDFRYIVPTMIVGSIAIGLMINELDKKRSAISKALVFGICVMLMVSSAAGVLTYYVLAMAS